MQSKESIPHALVRRTPTIYKLSNMEKHNQPRYRCLSDLQNLSSTSYEYPAASSDPHVVCNPHQIQLDDDDGKRLSFDI